MDKCVISGTIANVSVTQNISYTPHPSTDEVLTPRAIDFLLALHHRFENARRELLAQREERQVRFDAGERPDFLTETAAVREGHWRAATAPDALRDRRVEITGPVERKMMINALNSGAKVFMADLEDSNSPTWANVIEGQVNLADAVRGTIELTTRREGLPAAAPGGARDPGRAAAWLASDREALHRRR